MNQHQYSRHEISDADDHSEDGQLRTPHFMDTGGDDHNNRYGIILIWQNNSFFDARVLATFYPQKASEFGCDLGSIHAVRVCAKKNCK